jgi:hypothetical protein
MARDGGLGHVRAGVARPDREIELQALATLAALAQISTPSAAHFLKSHQLLGQKFAAATSVIPGGTEHEAWFREDTEVIDFFAPPRDDFLVGGKPAYMSEG